MKRVKIQHEQLKSKCKLEAETTSRSNAIGSRFVGSPLG
jgi:hypothetical protein